MSEILGALFKYLVALLGITAVVLVLYSVFSTNKTQTHISDVTQLATNTQSLYAAQSTFTTLTNAVAISSALAPSDMIAGTALTNPWGGTVTVAVNASNSQQFTITTTLVPAAACVKMATGFSSVVGLQVGAAGSPVAVALPADAGTVAGQCAATNTVIMTFGH
jgi:hypothetical protein